MEWLPSIMQRYLRYSYKNNEEDGIDTHNVAASVVASCRNSCSLRGLQG